MLRELAWLTAIVCALVILLGTCAHPKIDVDRRRQIAASVKIREVMSALEEYKIDCGEYPTVREGLEALLVNPARACWRGPYVEGNLLFDPWRRWFDYRVVNSQPEVISFGADGKPGGDFFDMDISSRDLWAQSRQSPRENRAMGVWIAIWLGAWAGFFGSIYCIIRKGRAGA